MEATDKEQRAPNVGTEVDSVISVQSNKMTINDF